MGRFSDPITKTYDLTPGTHVITVREQLGPIHTSGFDGHVQVRPGEYVALEAGWTKQPLIGASQLVVRKADGSLLSGDDRDHLVAT